MICDVQLCTCCGASLPTQPNQLVFICSVCSGARTDATITVTAESPLTKSFMGEADEPTVIITEGSKRFPIVQESPPAQAWRKAVEFYKHVSGDYEHFKYDEIKWGAFSDGMDGLILLYGDPTIEPAAVDKNT